MHRMRGISPYLTNSASIREKIKQKLREEQELKFMRKQALINEQNAKLAKIRQDAEKNKEDSSTTPKINNQSIGSEQFNLIEEKKVNVNVSDSFVKKRNASNEIKSAMDGVKSIIDRPLSQRDMAKISDISHKSQKSIVPLDLGKQESKDTVLHTPGTELSPAKKSTKFKIYDDNSKNLKDLVTSPS